MKSVNQVNLLGNLGKDAETKFTPSGVAVTNFSIATSRRWKQGDEWKEETDWHNVVLWKAENLASYLIKGQKVYVTGRLQTRNYEDKDGVKRYVTEVVVQAGDVVLCGGNKDGAAPAPGQPRSAPAARPANARQPAPPASRQAQPAASDGWAGGDPSDDDVPF